MEEIQKSRMDALAHALWAYNTAQLSTLLAGLRELPDIEYVRLFDVDKRNITVTGLAENEPATRRLVRHFEVMYTVPNSNKPPIMVGHLEVGANLDNAYSRLMSKAMLILLTQTLKTLLVAIAMLLIVHHFVGHPLVTIAQLSQQFGADSIRARIDLNRKPGREPDEFDQLVATLNRTRERISAHFEQLDAAQKELNIYREQLEILVQDRTTELAIKVTELEAERAEQRRLFDQLQEANQHLLQAEKMASIGQLAAGVAHEINNPIGFVTSNIGSLGRYFADLDEMLKAYEAAEPDLSKPTTSQLIQRKKQEYDLKFIREDIPNLIKESSDGLHRVTRIVQDLKDFARIGEVTMAPADLHECITSTLNVVRNEIRYKAEVQLNFGTLPLVPCIAPQINQVLLNLLVNAAQAIENRGTITITTGVNALMAWVTVADSGAGIAPENLSRIFDPFFTTKPVGTGTGLGLSVSYSIVRKHQGLLEVDSTVGVGTTFRLSLPRVQDAQSMADIAPEITTTSQAVTAS